MVTIITHHRSATQENIILLLMVFHWFGAVSFFLKVFIPKGITNANVYFYFCLLTMSFKVLLLIDVCNANWGYSCKA